MAGDPREARILSLADESAQLVFRHLEEFHGVSPHDASEILHEIKKENGRGPADNVALDFTGNVFAPEGVKDPTTRKWLGSLTERGAKRRRSR